jgi:hypothetical protein
MTRRLSRVKPDAGKADFAIRLFPNAYPLSEPSRGGCRERAIGRLAAYELR